jgi:glycine/D-amino acid oxidase-like deaminating enzyme
MAHRLGQQAVVIGGSLAGLMTARVLADHFDAVTVLERDYIDARPGIHKSIPQGNHLHGLLLGGQQVMASLYPGFRDQATCPWCHALSRRYRARFLSSHWW